MNSLTYAILFLCTTLVFISLAFYGWRQRHMPGAAPFGLCMLLFAIWPFAQALDVFTADLGYKILLMKLRVPPPYFAVLAWLVMSAQLTGQERLINWRRLFVLSIPFIGLTALLLIDSPLIRYGYFVDQSGSFPILRWNNTPLHLILNFYVTALYLLPLLLLWRSGRNLSTLSTRQNFMLSVSILAPLLTNILFQFNITPLPGFNLTPMVQAVTGLVIAWAIFRYRTFQILPLARNLLFDQIGDGMVVVDPLNRVIDMNLTARGLVGLPTSAMLGQHLSKVFGQWPTLLAQLVDRQEVQTEVAWPGNPPRYFDLHVTSLYDSTLQLTGRLCVFRELTEQKQAAEALQASEAKFRQLYDNNPLMLFSLATTGTVLAVNPMAVTQLGYAAEEMIGHSVLNVFHPEERAKVQETFERYVTHPVQTAPWEFRKVTKSGKTIWVSETLQFIREPQSESFVLVVCEDITARREAEDALRQAHGELEVRVQERTVELSQANIALAREIDERRQIEVNLRESEARFRAVVESSPNGIIMVDHQGSIVMVNSQTEQLFGYQRNELFGHTIEMLIPEHFHTQHTAKRSEFLASPYNRPMGAGYEITAVRKDGSKFPVDIALNIIEHQQGFHIMATVMDITARKQAEAERVKLEAQLQHAQKLESLGVLAGGIAHDFNNLLTGILGYTDLALHQLPQSSSARRSIEEAMKVTRQAAELTKQMLAYSGKGRFVVEPLDLSGLVEEMTRLLQISISKKCVMKYNFTPDLPTVEADATQVRQIIMNLVINASEAIGDQSGIITVSTGVMPCDRAYLAESYLDEKLPEGLYVYLEVADNGSGMSAETRARIFDPFFTTKFTGRGLGLAAVLGIVRGHGGAIKVFSEIGQGTIFRVLFPASTLLAKINDKEANGADQWRGSGTLLVVDDEEAVRETVRDLMETSGFAVLTAAHGREAVEIFRGENERIALVLLDMTMPYLDGEETLHELRQIRQDVNIVLMSGYSEQTVTKRLVDKGFAQFIQKPFGLDELLAVVRKTLEHNRNIARQKSLAP